MRTPAPRNTATTAPYRKVAVAAAAMVALTLEIVGCISAGRQKPVGNLDLSIPGATISYQSKAQDAIREKDFIIRGRKTTVQVNFCEEPVLVLSLPKPWATISDVRAQAEDWGADMQRQFPGYRDETGLNTFRSGDLKGFCSVTSLAQRGGHVGEQRNLFFLRAHKAYRLIFWFTRSDSKTDQRDIDKTWETVLNGLGISANTVLLERKRTQ